MLGKTVGKYRILDRLGRGGMGIVYKAVDETLDREVAIKVLNPDLVEPEVLKRFRAEAISLARLNHPGIATIYELYRHEEDLLMVMEFVRGETLQTLSERLGPLAPPQAAHLCIQVLDALAHAHRAGIVHRDLKPANVMVTDTGVVKVMDFGIARMMGAEHYTHAGYMMGTPAYMAPEQVLGQELDRRADLYSVGVLFYRLLTHELPFQADTAIAMAQKQVGEAPTPLGTFRDDLPPWCEAIIGKALAKSPDARFQTAGEFRAAILAAVSPVTLGEMPTMATPTAAGLLRTADVTVPHASGTGPTPTAVSGTAPTPSVERTGTTVVLGRGHLFAIAALLTVLVLGIVALGIAVLKRGAGTPPVATSPPAVPPAAVVSPSPNAERGSDQQQPTVPVTTVAREAAPAARSAAAAPPKGPKAAADTAPPPKATTATARTDAAPRSEPAPATTPPPATTAPPATTPAPSPVLAPVTFKDVKVLVPDGKTRRERDVVLTLAGDHLSLLDNSTRAELISLPYSSIAQAFYSRSKQPKWKGPDGKDVSVPVDLGKMGFFRGERNWVIFTTHADPVFIRFEDRQLAAAMRAIQDRTGVRIQR